MRFFLWKKRRIQYIGITLFLFYAFFYDIIDYKLGKTGASIFLLIIIFLMIIAIVNRGKMAQPKKVISLYLPWFLLFFLFVLPRNKALINGNYWLTIKWSVALLFSFVLTCNNVNNTRITKIIILLGLCHVFATWFFFMSPSSYSIMHRFWGKWAAGTSRGLYGFKAGLTANYSRNAIFITSCLIALCSSKMVFVRTEIRKKTQIIYTGIIALTAGAILLTAKRAGILFGFFAIIIVYYIINPAKRKGRLFKLICIIGAAFLIIEYLSTVSPEIERMLMRFSRIGEDNSTRNRFDMWRLALKMFESKPFLGSGWGSFRYEYYGVFGIYSNNDYEYLDAHNVYIQMMAETGIIGTILFFVCLVSAIRSTYNALKYRNVLSTSELHACVYSLAYQVYIVLYCFTGNCMYDITFLHYCVAIAIGYSCSYKIYVQTKSKKIRSVS